MKKISVIIIGAGDRGNAYSKQMAAMADRYEVVGVADPVATRRKTIQQRHGIPDSACFTGAEAILNVPKMADVAIIATMDDQHYKNALQAIDLGYHLLLEKPVARQRSNAWTLPRRRRKKGSACWFAMCCATRPSLKE